MNEQSESQPASIGIATLGDPESVTDNLVLIGGTEKLESMDLGVGERFGCDVMPCCELSLEHAGTTYAGPLYSLS